MQEFKFRYKKTGWLFWRSRKVIGYNIDQAAGRMVLFLPNGGILEIPNWAEYLCNLGTDWVLATKKQMEKEAGQPIMVNVVNK